MKRTTPAYRETEFTHGAVTIVHQMKSPHLDIDYLFLLEALEGGEVPADEHVETLSRMGLIERTGDGLALTMDARVKLANLRSLMRGYPMSPE